MSPIVDEMRNDVLLFSNPSWIGEIPTVPNTVIRNITALPYQIAFSALVKENITVLAARSATSVNGLLYVPDLAPDDPCNNQAALFVPDSAVRRVDLPPTNFNLVALAPWISSACSKKYMSSANFDPIRAFIFYRPGNSSTEPPAASSVLWDISGAAKWRSQSLYPVFAVSGSVGQEMMRQISLYSGNVTEVPYGANITQLLDPDPGDFVRIWTNITLSPPSSVFGIWVYFLIIVAVLVGIISATSLLMHLAQARRRLLLRRRVISGEVNLEGMGIKRLTVPISAVKEFPLYTYHYEPTTGQPVSPKPPEVSTTQPNQNSSISAILKAAGPHTTFVATHYQPVCSICLVEFQNRLTVIREIHCGHIFHQECIDEFLAEISSLCPVCKASMLPQGHCPKITNSMVRREYALRRLRHNATAEDDRQESKHDGKIPSFSVAALKHLFRERRIEASSFVTEETSTPPPPITPVARRTQPQQYEETRETTAAAARERMRELAGAGSQVSNDMARLSRWRRIRSYVFPGF